MNWWQNMTIGKKFALGFGLVLALLFVIGLASYMGVGGIVDNAHQVISGNQLDATLAEREVDHLEWANQLNLLLTDEKTTTIDVETDDHKCLLGQWLFGEERKKAEQELPTLAPLFKSMEEPHRRLHTSASEISKQFRQADSALGNFLREIKIKHLEWLGSIEDVFVKKQTVLDVETDHRNCGLGKWLYSMEADQLRRRDPQFAFLWSELEGPHQNLHKSVRPLMQIVSQGKLDEALKQYNETTHLYAGDTMEKVDKMIAWHASAMEGMTESRNIYANMTIPALRDTQGVLKDIRDLAKSSIISEDAMLESAQSTRRNVTILTIVAIIGGIILAYFIAKAIAGPVLNIANIIRRVAMKRDLTLEVPSESKDEIGRMANEFNTMLGMLNDAFIMVDNASKDINVQAGEVFQRASGNRERAIIQEKEVIESENILKAMGETAMEVQRASNAQRESANSSADRLKKLVDGMKKIEEASKNQMNEVNTTSERVVEMGETGAIVVSTAGKQGEAVARVTAAVNEFAKAVEEMTQVAGRSTEYGKQVLQAANEGTHSVNATVDGMRSIAESSDQIAEIISVITEIAEQTNLLALNAAIEAARAGAHGKGFAVVADEVGKLAQRSSEAAKEITSLIKDSTVRVSEGTKLTDQLAIALQRIAEGGQVNMKAIEDISRTANILSSGATNIHAMMEDLNSLAQLIAINAGKQRERREAAQKALSLVEQGSKSIVELVTDADRDADMVNQEMRGITNRTEQMEQMTGAQSERSKKAMNIAEKHVAGARATLEGAGRVVAISEALQQLSQSLTAEISRFKHKGVVKGGKKASSFSDEDEE